MHEKIGQSAIEYITTYGWMLVAVSIATTTLYTQVDRPCKMGVSGNFGSDIKISQVGLTTNNMLALSLESDTFEEIRLDKIKVVGDEETKYNNNSYLIKAGAARPLNASKANRSEACRDYQIRLIFDKGNLKGQVSTFSLRGPIDLLKSIISYLNLSGDSIDSLKVDATLMATGEDLCIGGECSTTEGPVVEKYVNRSGGEMTGALKTESITNITCIGGNCAVIGGSLDGYVSTKNNSMDGTLNTTEIKPINDYLCIGPSC